MRNALKTFPLNTLVAAALSIGLTACVPEEEGMPEGTSAEELAARQGRGGRGPGGQPPGGQPPGRPDAPDGPPDAPDGPDGPPDAPDGPPDAPDGPDGPPDAPDEPDAPDAPDGPAPGGDFDSFAPDPADNPISSEKVELGRLLFFDPILSGNQDVSCATCHHPRFGYADGIPLSIGVGGRGLGPARRLGPGTDFIGRNAPTVLNTGLNGWTNPNRLPNPNTAPMFWDNREESLEAQALGPIRNREEMRGDLIAEDEIVDVVVERLERVPEYVDLFNDAFGPGGVDELRLAQAISAFERHLSRPNTRFDSNTLTPQEQRGLNAFRAAGCADCHGGPMFSDFQLHRLGAPDNPQGNNPDLGDGQRRFRTPTLRNIALTGPYMHGGTFRTLQDVLNFYLRQSGGPGGPGGRPGGPPPPNGQNLAPQLLDLRMNPATFPDMIAFMESLNDADIDREEPPAVPSGLPVGGR